MIIFILSTHAHKTNHLIIVVLNVMQYVHRKAYYVYPRPVTAAICSVVTSLSIRTSPSIGKCFIYIYKLKLSSKWQRGNVEQRSYVTSNLKYSAGNMRYLFHISPLPFTRRL